MPTPGKHPQPCVRLLPKQDDALELAITTYRKRTGEDMDKAKALRLGAAWFCKENGVKWPAEGTKS